MTASFDASRTSFVREGSFRGSSTCSQQGGSSERDEKAPDKKKGSGKLSSSARFFKPAAVSRKTANYALIFSSRPARCSSSPPTWHCLSPRGCGVPHGTAGTWRASRHPPPTCAHRAAGASRLVPGISSPQPEELPLQEAAVAPS